MPEIHPSAIIDGKVELADDVVIGPNCVLTGPIAIGAGTRLIGGVYLHGPLRLGERNVLYPTTCLGFAPQHNSFDPATLGMGTVIGDDNVFREGSSIHRAFQKDQPTRVGSNCWFMTSTHAGHDCQIGDRVTLTASAIVAGHVEVGDGVILAGDSAAHQFVRIGRGAMVGGKVAVARDVPPLFICTHFDHCGSVNLVGMRRSGMSSAEIEGVRWVHRTLYRSRLPLTKAMDRLRERGDEPLIAEFISFIEGSARGICSGGGARQRSRGPERSVDERP